MLDARLKILALSGYGDIRDALWAAWFMIARGEVDIAKEEKRRKMRKAYLARYLHQPLNTWDHMTRSEIGEWVEACSEIMVAESKNESIPV